MLRSMYSGISGMKVNQTRLDVVGNNITNVGTTAFKGSRTTFKDTLSQSVSDSMAPSSTKGGVNGAQVGLGVQLASIDRVMTQGNVQATNRALDVAIDGDGFFMVSSGPELLGGQLQVNHTAGNHTITDQSLATSGTEIMYTRDGAFTLDKEGNLLTSDGFRILGYSLTNDDNAMQATGQSSSSVTTAGMNFKFGPGSQLNGYSVVLGEIGPGTVTTSTVDKSEKKIILNGDFSTPGALTTAQVEAAINKGLSSAGISQTIGVNGKPVTISELASDRVAGGANATAPSPVSVGGFTFQLSEGSELNGYSFEVGKIGSGQDINIEVDPGKKKVVINADFVTKGALSGKMLVSEINAALSEKGITQSITNFSGSQMSLSQVYATTDESGSIASGVAGETIDKDGNAVGPGLVLGGLNFNFSEGSGLDGYTIKFGDTSKDTATKVSLNRSDKIITINADFESKTVAELENSIKTAFNNELTKNSISTVKLEGLTGLVDVSNSDEMAQLLKLSGGTDLLAPKPLEIGGLTVTLPKGEDYNGFEIEIVDVKATSLSAKLDPSNPKKILISGDFVTPNEVTASKLGSELNKLLGIADTEKNKVLVSGSATLFTGLASSAVDGGIDLATPNVVKASGLEFEFTPGGDLNGYTIQIGTVSAGTKTSANIDTSNKVIKINADLVNGGASAATIQNAINQALQEKNINQAIKVIGQPTQISGIESDITSGGTPIESINGDGSILFVDASQDLKSYDGDLKTLKIPDKVKIAGTDQELRVKSYTIDSSGIINGILEDGRVAALGQIAMASFKNPEGLTSLGGNLYGSTVNSGEAVIKSGIGTLDDDNSKGYGDNLQGYLEMSNVDLSEQFTELIVATRAFQASGKMINTGDEILQEIINLKR